MTPRGTVACLAKAALLVALACSFSRADDGQGFSASLDRHRKTLLTSYLSNQPISAALPSGEVAALAREASRQAPDLQKRFGELKELYEQGVALQKGRDPDDSDPLGYLRAAAAWAKKLSLDEEKALRVAISAGYTPDPATLGKIKQRYAKGTLSDRENGAEVDVEVKMYAPVFLFLKERLPGETMDSLAAKYRDRTADDSRVASKAEERLKVEAARQELAEEKHRYATKAEYQQRTAFLNDRIAGISRGLGTSQDAGAMGEGLAGAPGGGAVMGRYSAGGGGAAAAAAIANAASPRMVSLGGKTVNLEQMSVPAPAAVGAGDRYKGREVLNSLPLKPDGTPDLKPGDVVYMQEPYFAGMVNHSTMVVRLRNGQYMRRNAAPGGMTGATVCANFNDCLAADLNGSAPAEDAAATKLVYKPRKYISEDRTTGDVITDYMRETYYNGNVAQRHATFCSWDTGAIQAKAEWEMAGSKNATWDQKAAYAANAARYKLGSVWPGLLTFVTTHTD